MSALETYLEHRPAMLAAAFRITGSRADAEDVVQETWERWERVDGEQIASPRAYLCVMASRLALNALRTQRRRRESYVGPWLPEVVVDDGSVEWSVLQQDGLGQALDVVLAALSPEQATAYVLRKVLDLSYAEIAQVLETSQPAARQILSRAQRAVEAALTGDAATRRAHDTRALTALAHAITAGDVAAVVALLAPDSTLHADGGGLVTAALRPVVGSEKVARLLLGLAQRPDLVVLPAALSGGVGFLTYEAGVLTTVMTVRTQDRGDGTPAIQEVYMLRNPQRLPQVPPHPVRITSRSPTRATIGHGNLSPQRPVPLREERRQVTDGGSPDARGGWRPGGGALGGDEAWNEPQR